MRYTFYMGGTPYSIAPRTQHFCGEFPESFMKSAKNANANANPRVRIHSGTHSFSFGPFIRCLAFTLN